MFSLYLFVCFLLFCTGFFSILFGKSNLILIIIGLELLLLSLSLLYLVVGWCLFADLKVALFSIFLLCIGASESAIGLALTISYYKYNI